MTAGARSSHRLAGPVQCDTHPRTSKALAWQQGIRLQIGSASWMRARRFSWPVVCSFLVLGWRRHSITPALLLLARRVSPAVPPYRSRKPGLPRCAAVVGGETPQNRHRLHCRVFAQQGVGLPTQTLGEHGRTSHLSLVVELLVTHTGRNNLGRNALLGMVKDPGGLLCAPVAPLRFPIADDVMAARHRVQGWFSSALQFCAFHASGHLLSRRSDRVGAGYRDVWQ